MIHSNTTNTTFLRMYYILDQMGVKNNSFFLQLYDSSLANVDPFDEEHLTDEQKLRIHIEIQKNPWYYFREIVRFPAGMEKQRFELTRATLAIIWCLINDLHTYIIIPRQCGKSYTVAAFYSWLIYWGSKDFTAAFFGNNDSLSTQNLSRVKDLRENLPKYLNLKNNFDVDNQHMLIFNEGTYKNTVITKAPGMNEDSANNVGRGNSTMCQWYDEFAYTPYIWVQYAAAMPAYSKVAEIAEKTGSHHHIIITTTAGNKNSPIGKFAYNFLNQCANFSELLYDKCFYDKYGNCTGFNREEINDYITNNNTGRRFLRVEFQWHELSKPLDYLEKQQAELAGMDEFARGILNIWTDSNADHPLGQERVQALMEKISSPVKIQMIDKIYVLKYYRDPELLKTQSKYIVFGMDCSGNTRKDYSTLVGVDVTNSEVVVTMRVNGYALTRFGKAVAYILLYLFPESVLVGERNYTGKMVLEVIELSIGKSRIYIDDKDGELGVSMVHKLRVLMYSDILRISVVELGHMIHDKTIIEEIGGLITDKHGRIDHKQNGGHDDLLIAYLYCRWFIMYCKTKNKYIDRVFFNSRLNRQISDDKLNEMVKYNSDKYDYEYVMSDRGKTMDMQRAFDQRGFNSRFVDSQIKTAMDNAIIGQTPIMGSGHLSDTGTAEDYMYIYDKMQKEKAIDKNEISVDDVADEFLNSIHEYSEDLDKDDPEKIAQETEEKRDTSKDPPKSMFHFDFLC